MSGMAGKVRRSTESDEFDLANYDQAKCDELCKAAFSEPFPLAEMVRLSFVVGGGKLVRQKYTDDLPKIMMCALNAVNFKEDGAADRNASSGGKFKYQHDTGKNLKFVHVYPHISGPGQAAQGDAEEGEEEDDRPLSHEDLLFRSGPKEFSRLTEEHVTTYGQKKKLLDLLKARISALEAIESKMATLQQLDAKEQALFDDVGAEDLREKVKTLNGMMQQMVDSGELTSDEKAAFIDQLDGKLEELQGHLAKAEAEGKAKKVTALTAGKAQLEEARAKVKDCNKSLPPLRHEKEMKKLYAKLAELARIEKASKGNYTMDELKKLGERSELQEALGILEDRSRGWFEADDVFEERVQACKRAAGSAPKAKAKASSSAGGGYTSVTGGASRPKAKAGGMSTSNKFGAFAD